jgi:hypothetical protein
VSGSVDQIIQRLKDPKTAELLAAVLGAMAGRRRRARMRDQLSHARRVVNTRLERVRQTETAESIQHLGR